MDGDLKTKIEEEFLIRLNKNQWKEIKRLFFEIHLRDDISYENVITSLKNTLLINKYSGQDKFFIIKNCLIKKRFPQTYKKEKIDAKNVFLPDLKEPLDENIFGSKIFIPEKIFVEKTAGGSELLKRFQDKFPSVSVEELDYYGEFVKKYKYSLAGFKRPFVFIVRENWDFIKPCPCTKKCLPCNYWVFNLGFGCPFDCSYCFLQQYANFPGIILPYNLDDFFNKFSDFYKKIKHPIRMGTGEFCDSLALDNITTYSHKLIDFFRDKHLYFELKTKSNNIDNLLKIQASPNIVISWSLNPQSIIEKEELAAASLKERIDAARKVKDKGFSLAFHFDPIIHCPDWRILYKETIDILYNNIGGPFKWISLGTLRSHRGLKCITEQRFQESRIFYGELLLGEDKKLRYPQFIKEEIYKNMINWIHCYDSITPIYLCMEDEITWQTLFGKKSLSSHEVENYLLNLIL